MKYYCDECKTVLDENDLDEVSEGRPGAFGAPCEETFYVCPECGNIPAEYNYQDKSCSDCVNNGTDACPYGGEYIKVCGDFLEEE